MVVPETVITACCSRVAAHLRSIPLPVRDAEWGADFTTRQDNFLSDKMGGETGKPS